MDFTGPVIAFFFIIIVVRLLLKKYNPHAVLLFSGLIMMVISWLLGYEINSLLNLEGLERKMKIGEVNVTFVHGDILDHLDWLESINASLVLRRKLLTKCLEKSPYLIKNSVNLQPRWDVYPISNLRWSGTEANQDLTKMMMQLCITDTMATISHRDASTEYLLASLKELPKDCPKNLILFHKDENDYFLN